MRTSMHRVATLVLAIALAACASSQNVDLSGNWPTQASDYESAHARWTRRNTIHSGLDHVMTVAATALSPDFRAAYAAERARRLDMSAEERDALLAAEKATSDGAIEFEVLLATNKPDWNDLGKYPRSMWRIALVGDDGREVLPTSILPDKRVRAEVESWYSDLGPFYKPYIVSFPRVAADGKPILSPGTKVMRLELASAVGKTSLVWSE
jgi:hypothetical protein